MVRSRNIELMGSSITEHSEMIIIHSHVLFTEVERSW